MQYKQNKKIIIDKRKLDILIRLGCPDVQILELIKTGDFTRTGDSLIDDTLECLIDRRDFKNWGGNHNPTGKNQYTKRGQVDHQVDHQVELGQLAGQVVDKDIDIYNNTSNKVNSIKERDIKGKPLKEEEEEGEEEREEKKQFEEFWKYYTPVKSKDGRFVSKGNKQECLKKYVKILNEGVKHETIITNLEKYLRYCQENGYSSCGASVYLNQRRFENDYSGVECVDSKARDVQRRPCSIVQIAAELTRESKDDDSDSIPF